MITLGIDVGGTFTDLVLRDSVTGTMRALKTPSTPSNHAEGVMNAIRSTGVAPSEITAIGHGMTVATNTALEMNGARLGIITTRGFRDVLVIGRGNRTKLYDIKATRPEPLVERRNIVEVDGRLTAAGEVHLALDEDQVKLACNTLAEAGVEAVAICFLHSYINPEHERRAGEIARVALPGIPVSLSSDVLPEYREFERFSTTALNAYVAPRVGRYLRSLADELVAEGVTAPLSVMGSNGGTWSAAAMAERPVNSMLSGPAGGVTAAVAVASMLSENNIITYDMGGTSTDAALIRGSTLAMTTEAKVGMWPNRAPQIEINTVGAGGGSLAYLDAGRFLRVGPRSAGAEPGPACYGKGGTEPTVTDANVVLGRFLPGHALGGTIELNVDAARAAVASLGNELDLDPERTADGIIRLAVARMTATVKEISVMRGLDPRDFTLFAYGGAGPLHAALIAEELGMRRIVVPTMPGNFSAYGLLAANTRHDLARTRLMPLAQATLAEIEAELAPLRAEANERLAADGFTSDHIQISCLADMRFAGQAFELTIALPENAETIEDIATAFRRDYEERYSHADEGAIEIVCLRVIAIGESEPAPLPDVQGGETLKAALMVHRPVRFGDATVNCPIYSRTALPLETPITGPAIIEEDGATTVVPPGFSAHIERHGNLILEREA
ncbi:MAG: hydantoinase/oxoprolinase family protein [Rhodospirillaceae bacterium]|nr:hydantoinase/oxoprolinase family protein [Rhodospirillaceae bacterium]